MRILGHLCGPAAVKKAREASLYVHGARLFNLIPDNEEIEKDHEEQEVEHPDIEEDYQQDNEDAYCPDDLGAEGYDEDNHKQGGDTYDHGDTDYD